jgi:hypothetical protein
MTNPYVMDLYRFRGDLTSIDFQTTPRYFGSDPKVPHMWYDPYKLDGRTSRPLFSQGIKVDGRQTSHWKDDYDEKTHTFHPFIGVMDPSPYGSIKYSFTLPDIRAFSRLGYRVNRSYTARPFFFDY